MPIRYVKKEFCYLYKTFSFLENSWVCGRAAVNPTIKCACRLKTSHPGPTILGKWVNSVTFSGTENVSQKSYKSEIGLDLNVRVVKMTQFWLNSQSMLIGRTRNFFIFDHAISKYPNFGLESLSFSIYGEKVVNFFIYSTTDYIQGTGDFGS